MPSSPPLIILLRVNRLTRQEITFIVTLASLLLVGLLVKHFRLTHPAAVTISENAHARD